MGFSRRRALVASADDAWAIRVSSAGEFRMGREEGLGHEGERVDRKATSVKEDELEARDAETRVE